MVEYVCNVFNLHLISDLELLNQGACKALNKDISWVHVHIACQLWYSPGMRGWRARTEKPLPCGPLGARMSIKRGTPSSPLSLRREIRRSGRSFIFKTLQAEDFPLR